MGVCTGSRHEGCLAACCVDDKGGAAPCTTPDGKTQQSGVCWSVSGRLHDLHLTGCGAPVCLESPGVGLPSSPAERASRHDAYTVLSQPPPPPPLPVWHKRQNDERIAALEAAGYFNCTAFYDESKVVGSCSVNEHRREARRWLHYVWGQRSTAAVRPARQWSAAARAVSWWAARGSEDDGFDPHEFIDSVVRLHAGRQPVASQKQSAPATVSFLGDSTLRQQTVSLCCMLRAGCAAATITNGALAMRGCSAKVTRAVPFGHFECEVRTFAGGDNAGEQMTRAADTLRKDRRKQAKANGGAGSEGYSVAARLVFDRITRLNANPTWRPPEPHPAVPRHVLDLIRRTPTVLVLNMGAWEYEDGCDDMHSTHDSLCNGTRPWILGGYALKWQLLLAAVERVYAPLARDERGRTGALVVLRTSPPRDFQGSTALRGGRCDNTTPLAEAALAAEESAGIGLRSSASSGGTASTGMQLSSMRYAVMAQNGILLAAAAERSRPYLRVLDAYGIARRRADAHPSTAPRHLRSRSAGALGINQDCQHYCLPGIPDVWNGRLLRLISHQASSATTAAGARQPSSFGGGASDSSFEALGEPLPILRRWNFALPGGEPFVQLVQRRRRLPERATLALKLGAGSAWSDEPPTHLSCDLPRELRSRGASLLGFCN